MKMFLPYFLVGLHLFIASCGDDSSHTSRKKVNSRPADTNVLIVDSSPSGPADELPNNLEIRIQQLPTTPISLELLMGLENKACTNPSVLSIHKEAITSSDGNYQVEIDLRSKISQTLHDGNYKFFAKIQSKCYQSQSRFTLDTTAPRVVISYLNKSPLQNDDNPTKAKTWSWDCHDLSTCQYRTMIESAQQDGTCKSGFSFSASDAYKNYNDASIARSQSSGDGKYCIYIQAKDLAGNESAVTGVYAILDNTGPSIQRVVFANPSSGTYGDGDRISLIISFDEDVAAIGSPQIALTVGSQTRQAVYQGYGQTNNQIDKSKLVFDYTVVSSDRDSDGVVVANTIALNGGSITDLLGNPPTLLNFGPPTSSTPVDGSAPNVLFSDIRLSMGENGRTNYYYLKLNHQPSADVTVNITSSDTTVTKVSGGGTTTPTNTISLSFTPSNYGTDQIVTVTNVNDDIDNDYGGGSHRTTSLTHSVTSGDSDYNGLNLPSVHVTATDDDDIGNIRLTANPNLIEERDPSAQDGQPGNNTESVAVTASFIGSTSGGNSVNTVRLSSDVVLPVTVGPGDTNPATANEDYQAVPNFNLTIAAGNNTARGSFNLTTIDDTAQEEDETIKLTATHTHFPTISPATITLRDDDKTIDGDIVLSKNTASIRWEGDSVGYTVRLSEKPRGPVTVTITSSDPTVAKLRITGTARVYHNSLTLTFLPNNYSRNQYLSIKTIAEPSQIRDRTATITHSASGGGYVNVAEQTIDVSVLDSDPFVSITDAPDIDINNYKRYAVSGGCKGIGNRLEVKMNQRKISTSCLNERWSVTFTAPIVTFRPQNGGMSGILTLNVVPNTQHHQDKAATKKIRYCLNPGEIGSSLTSYVICNYEDLKKVKAIKGNSYEQVTYSLAFDIDASPSWSEGAQGCTPYDGVNVPTSNPCSGWTPLNHSGQNENTTIRGNGNTIRNLYMHGTTDLGLFGSISGRGDFVVTNIHLEDFFISKYDQSGNPQERNVGGLIAKASHATTIITDSTVKGTIKILGSAKAGGFIGSINNKGYIENRDNHIANMSIKNILGNNSADLAMTVDDNKAGYYGGLVGHVALKKGSSWYSGILGIAGSFTKGSITLLDNITENSGTFYGLGHLGGLVGYVEHGIFAVDTAYSRMNLSRGQFKGGIVGEVDYDVNVSLKNAYYAGSFQSATIPNGFSASTGEYPIGLLDRGARVHTDTTNDGIKDCRAGANPGYLLESNLFYDTTTTSIAYPHPDGAFTDQSGGEGFSCSDQYHPIGPTQEGLATSGIQVSCSDSTGICALSNFQFTSGQYPKIKKCSDCQDITTYGGNNSWLNQTFIFTPSFDSALVPGQ